LQADYGTVVEDGPIMSVNIVSQFQSSTFGQNERTLQRGLSAIAEHLVFSEGKYPEKTCGQPTDRKQQQYKVRTQRKQRPSCDSPTSIKLFWQVRVSNNDSQSLVVRCRHKISSPTSTLPSNDPETSEIDIRAVR